MPDHEWIKTLADGTRVKYTHDELTDFSFITAQTEGNRFVYSIMLSKAETPLSREESQFEHEISRK